MTEKHAYEKPKDVAAHLADSHPGFDLMDPDWEHNPYITHEAMHNNMERPAEPQLASAEATMWYAVQAYGRIDPARREFIDEEIQRVIAGHNCDIMRESQCNVEFLASTSHNEEHKVQKWLGLDD